MALRKRQPSRSRVCERSFKVAKPIKPAPQASSGKRNIRDERSKAAARARLLDQAARAAPPFFRLPQSVRRQIYSYLTCNHDDEHGPGVVVIVDGTKGLLSPEVEKVFSISRQFTREARPQFYAKNHFIIEDDAGFAGFLKGIGDAGRRSLRSIQIEWRSDREDRDRRSTFEGIQLLRTCSHLEELRIEFWDPDPKPSFRASAEVHELRKLRGLQSLKLVAENSWMADLPNLGRLREWLAIEVTKRDRYHRKESDDDMYLDCFWAA